jgi:hypothetical protein
LRFGSIQGSSLPSLVFKSAFEQFTVFNSDSGVEVNINSGSGFNRTIGHRDEGLRLLKGLGFRVQGSGSRV